MSAFDADVIVAGAGPAGAAAAAHLAAAGVRVILLERRRFPRDKVCGDFVGPVGLAELAALGVDLPPANVCDRAGLFADGDELITYVLPQLDGLPAHGCVIPRLELDAAIAAAARRAGARIEEETSLLDFSARDGTVEAVVRSGGGERRLRARVLVGADGASSTVARIVRGGAPQRDDFLVAVRAYFTGVEGPANRCDLAFTTASFPGYAWVFPTGAGTANVGVGMVVDTFPAGKEQMRDLLARLVARDPAMRARLQHATLAGAVTGWPLATYSGRTPTAADGVVLVGDAAGLINPLNGEGIQAALCSARWAAAVIAAALARDDCSVQALHAYTVRLRAELGVDMLLARLVVRAIANRTLNPLWLAMLRAVVARARVDARYALATGGVVAGLVPVRSAFTTPMLVTSATVIARELERAAWRTAGLRVDAFDALVRTWAPAAEMALQPAVAARWLAALAGAARDLVAARPLSRAPCMGRVVESPHACGAKGRA